MNAIVPYSIQPQSVTCSAMSSYVTHVSPYVMKFALAIPLIKAVVNSITPSNQQNEDQARRVTWLQTFKDVFFPLGLMVSNRVLVFRYHKYCSHFEPWIQQKKRQSSLKLAELFEAGVAAKNHFFIGGLRALDYLEQYQKQIYTAHALGERSVYLESAGCDFLKNYFPGDKKLEAEPIKCNSEAYFQALNKSLVTKQMDLSPAEKKFIRLWNSFLKAEDQA